MRERYVTSSGDGSLLDESPMTASVGCHKWCDGLSGREDRCAASGSLRPATRSVRSTL